MRDEYEIKHRSFVNSLQYDYAHDHLYSVGSDSVIRRWDVSDTSGAQSQRLLNLMEHHSNWVNDIVLCSEGSRRGLRGDFLPLSLQPHRHSIINSVISASSDSTVKVWNARTGSWWGIFAIAGMYSFFKS